MDVDAPRRQVYTAIFPTRKTKARHRHKQFCYQLCVPCRDEVEEFGFMVGGQKILWSETSDDPQVLRMWRKRRPGSCGVCGGSTDLRHGEIYGYIAETAMNGAGIMDGRTISMFCATCCEKDWVFLGPVARSRA